MAPILLILSGVFIMLSPVLLTMMNNSDQAGTSQDYSESISQADPAELDAERARAFEWNASQDFRVAGDPWTIQPDLQGTEYQTYLEQLSVNPVMSRIQVPSAEIDLPVYHGTEETTLSHGVGHLFGTALPVGGMGTHTVLTGHTGIATATLFDNLVGVQSGDLMSVETLGETLFYRVTQTQTVLPEDTESIRPIADQELLTLITCTPYGVNSHRLLVTGERVLDGDAHAMPDQLRTPGLQGWMYLALGLSALLLLLLMGWMLWVRKNKARKN